MLKTVSPLDTDLDIKANVSFKLGNIQIGLLSNSELVIARSIQEFLGDWIATEKAPSLAADDIQIHLKLVDHLPDLPTDPPRYRGNNRLLKDGIGTLSVYHEANGYLLYFLKSGLIRISSNHKLIHGFITIDLLNYHRLFDLIFTSLSPFLRRHGYYLVHGSAAVQDQSASIFVGPLGSAKSTTVLNLALNGWGTLSDDTLLLEERPDGIYALPTPGGFSIRPQSFNHIPSLASYAPQPMNGESFQLSLSRLGLAWAEARPISTIYFPKVENIGSNQYHPLPPALTLAHLIELSLDRWDLSSLPDHITFLEKLSRQAKAVSLKITNQQTLPELLTRNA